MHAANRNTNCVQHNKTHVDKSARCRANSRPRTHTMTENGARVSEPRHVTETKDMSAGIQTPRSNMKQGTQTRERATRAHSKPRAHMKTRTWWEYQGSVTKPWITLDRRDRTLTQGGYFYFQQLLRCSTEQHFHRKSPLTDDRIIWQRHRFPQRTLKRIFYCELLS